MKHDWHYIVGGVLGFLGLRCFAECRNPRFQPFDNATVWNNAVGSRADYFPASIYANGVFPAEGVFNDDDYFVVSTLDDPKIRWYSQGHWNATPNCEQFPWSPLVGNIHWPINLTIEKGGNNALALLQPDNITLLLTQPAYRCGVGDTPLLSIYDHSHPNCSLYGLGNWGGHGGSALNAIGGSLRVGELLPVSPGPGPRHVLKLQLWAKQYYYGVAYGQNWSNCYHWPALVCDGYANDPTLYGGANPLLTPGTLLAIPPGQFESLNASLFTVPARMLAWTLTNYGGLLCDDTYADRATFNVEHGFTDSFEAAWGFPFSGTGSGGGIARKWIEDVVALFRALPISANNGPTTMGGGGTPAQPAPPPFC